MSSARTCWCRYSVHLAPVVETMDSAICCTISVTLVDALPIELPELLWTQTCALSRSQMDNVSHLVYLLYKVTSLNSYKYMKWWKGFFSCPFACCQATCTLSFFTGTLHLSIISCIPLLKFNPSPPESDTQRFFGPLQGKRIVYFLHNSVRFYSGFHHIMKFSMGTDFTADDYTCHRGWQRCQPLEI